MTIPPESSSVSSSEANGKEEINSSPQLISPVNLNSSQEAVKPLYLQEVKSSNSWLLLTAVGVMGIGLLLHLPWIGLTGAIVSLILSLRVIFPSVIVIPRANPINAYTMAGIISDAGLSIEEFKKFL